ncbi:hypothetical protein [Hahella ganghwensis]|uniref:hypothetical protein n=1 Tax=Hahella ganghwensis TaxID=286420 RepID=UPI00037C9BF1|nr:hypothetical protein [Hahella ganghwensis]
MEYRCKTMGYLFVAAALAGCGGGGGEDSWSGGRVENLTLEASNAYPGNYILNKGKVAEIRKIMPLNDGGSMIVGHYERKPSSMDARSFLVRLDENQKIVSTNYHSNGYMDSCIHPSGEISLAELNKDGDRYGVTLKRYSGEGGLLYKTSLRDDFSENRYQVMNRKLWEQSGYLINEFSDRPGDADYEVRYSSSVHAFSNARYNIVKLTCNEERLVVYLNHEGPKITVYDSHLQKEWTAPLTIYEVDNSLVLDRTFAEVAVDDAGNIYGISEIHQGSIPNYNHRFKTKLPYDIDAAYNKDLIVRKFSRNGELLEEKVVGTQEMDLISDAVVHNGMLYALANSRIKKSDMDNETKEWDIGLFAINPVSLEYTHEWLDLNQQDWATGMTVDGNDLYLFGVTGYQQKDTNSIVSNGHGFYKRLPDGVVQDDDYVKIAGRRHGIIHDMSVFQGMINAVGVTDAPITHTKDRNSSGLFYRSAN